MAWWRAANYSMSASPSSPCSSLSLSSSSASIARATSFIYLPSNDRDFCRCELILLAYYPVKDQKSHWTGAKSWDWVRSERCGKLRSSCPSLGQFGQ